ncbi:unnamed protein product [Zymoseptoria tritici ST99CH_1A5]|uniref:Uncharacterized protein n=1 Tax=Zymoseptoria tritici ST99CH_1A5 TaxID=1276529 RepID=A0A1Y6LPP4_ZYMTR|nr:unnamed protein product [Zymoseptoria tritici ST99CH_1A5]
MKKPTNRWVTQRKLIFRTDLTRANGIWGDVFDGVHNELKDLWQLHQDEIIQGLCQTFSEIRNELDNSFNQPINPTEEALQLMLTMGEKLEEARTMLTDMDQLYEQLSCQARAQFWRV